VDRGWEAGGGEGVFCAMNLISLAVLWIWRYSDGRFRIENWSPGRTVVDQSQWDQLLFSFASVALPKNDSIERRFGLRCHWFLLLRERCK
jgi:hypothetical protein